VDVEWQTLFNKILIREKMDSDKNTKIIWLDQKCENLFKNAGLAKIADFMNAAKILESSITKVMREHSDKRGTGEIDRSVVRVRLNDAVFFIKQGSANAYVNITNEFDAIRVLPRFGLRPAELAGYAFDETNKSGFIILKDLDGFNSINDMFNGNAPPEAVADFNARKEPLLARIAEIIKKVHAAGYVYSDWFGKHIFIKPGCDDIALIDLERFRPLSKCPWYFGVPIASIFVKRKILRKLTHSLKSELLSEELLREIF
jgi:hypothetical protein